MSESEPQLRNAHSNVFVMCAVLWCMCVCIYVHVLNICVIDGPHIPSVYNIPDTKYESNLLAAYKYTTQHQTTLVTVTCRIMLQLLLQIKIRSSCNGVVTC